MCALLPGNSTELEETAAVAGSGRGDEGGSFYGNHSFLERKRRRKDQRGQPGVVDE